MQRSLKGRISAGEWPYNPLLCKGAQHFAPSFRGFRAFIDREGRSSPTGRGGLLPGQPSSQSADRAAQDAPRFAPRTAHTPRTKLMRPPRPFRSPHTRRPTQHSPPPKANVRPRARLISNSARPPRLTYSPAAASLNGTARTRLVQACQLDGRGKRTPILQAHDSLPFLRAKRRATVSGIEPTSPGFRRNVVAPTRRASISTSLPENMMIGVCCR